MVNAGGEMVKMKCCRFTVLALVPWFFASALGGEGQGEKPPAFVIPSPGEVPDLTQTDPKGEFARGGKSYCGPVAVSNSLMALCAEALRGDGIDHYALVNLLASETHMKTDPVSGTGARGVIRGVEAFLKANGIDGYQLFYQGWRSHPEEFGTGVREVELDWMRDALAASGGAVWINLGWYAHDSETDAYTRVGGHWVTVVGYGRDEKGKVDGDVFLVHDPAPRAGSEPSVEFVRMTPISRGRIVGKTSGKRLREAKGMYRMEGGMHIKPIADCAIVDGAVALRLSVGHPAAAGE